MCSIKSFSINLSLESGLSIIFNFILDSICDIIGLLYSLNSTVLGLIIYILNIYF
jgi:hypothetical protein